MLTPLRLVAVLALLLLSGIESAPVVRAADSDLDLFMREALARRDENWKKLQQYVLDEHERLEMRGPAHTPLFGEDRDYTWYIREGFFVRSPLKVNGATVSEEDRRKYETEFLAREKRRDAKAQGRRSAELAPASPPPTDAPRDLDSLIRQTQQPQFISSAYFLRFQFDQGRYALVGRETVDGRQALKIEYYPTNLFRDDDPPPAKDQSEAERKRREAEQAQDVRLMGLMNKKSKVTLWIEPSSHQILKYVFDDLNWNFFPAQWALRISKVTASMSVGEVFPDVWLPRTLDMQIAMLMAPGTIDVNYQLVYHDYRQPDVKATIGVPGQR